MRRVENLVGITKSVTICDLAPDYPLFAELSALTVDGTELSGKEFAVRTEKPTAGSEPVAFTVTYDAGIGEFLRLRQRRVLFGSAPTKAPAVYAPDGYRFTGWSVDGVNLVDLSASRIYEDTRFIALLRQKTA